MVANDDVAVGSRGTAKLVAVRAFTPAAITVRRLTHDWLNELHFTSLYSMAA